MTKAAKKLYDHKRWKELPLKKRKARYGTNREYRMGLVGKFGILRRSAKARKISITLTLEQFSKLNVLPCFYCGGALPVSSHGIDRTNSRRGYSLTNVKPCCKFCNRAKYTFTESEFLEWLHRVQSHKF